MSDSARDQVIADFEEKLFDTALGTDHAYRKLNHLINFDTMAAELQKLYSNLGQPGIPPVRGLKALLLQFWEDYSDREMEAGVRENLAIRWFCGFSLTEKTPDHSYFGKFRKRIGTTYLANMFNAINERLQKEGLFGNIFYFIDASTIITKSALWEERDRAIKDGHDKLNNVIVSEYAADNQARWGAKSKNNIWFGYKRHNAVDMRFGLISNVAVTPANTPDYKAVKDICPTQGLVFMDKGYDYAEADAWVRANGCVPATLRKNNNKEKNHDLDCWRSGIRMPFESTFSKQRKRAKYRGQTKVTFQCYVEAMVYNLKKAVRLLPRLTQMET